MMAKKMRQFNIIMKNSLIPKKHLVQDKNYWCLCSGQKDLRLLTYSSNGIFSGQDTSTEAQNIRVMFEGYANINKSRIPRKYLVSNRYYWCRYKEENDLQLMRYEENGSFYLVSLDFHLPSTEVKVIFEDY